ncbi:MAG: hypothetical protein ABJA49_15225, partial [Betaproteobacteria bacterium]
PVRGDFEEGFQAFGENGSMQGRVYLPWFHKTSVVECFSARDGLFRDVAKDAPWQDYADRLIAARKT